MPDRSLTCSDGTLTDLGRQVLQFAIDEPLARLPHLIDGLRVDRSAAAAFLVRSSGRLLRQARGLDQGMVVGMQFAANSERLPRCPDRL